jgi:hypothetical protein
MVWVNTDSGVYHKEGTRYYGKTKTGKYMSEADAQKAGFRAAKNATRLRMCSLAERLWICSCGLRIASLNLKQ